LKNLVQQTLGKTHYDFVTFLTAPQKPSLEEAAAFGEWAQTGQLLLSV